MRLVAGVDSSTQSCKVVVCDAATGAATDGVALAGESLIVSIAVVEASSTSSLVRARADGVSDGCDSVAGTDTVRITRVGVASGTGGAAIPAVPESSDATASASPVVSVSVSVSEMPSG